jgi:hypothetical protein
VKKLQLDVETLQVDSFELAAAEAGVGTVRAHLAPQQAVAASTLSYLRPCFYTEQASCTC